MLICSWLSCSGTSWMRTAQSPCSHRTAARRPPSLPDLHRVAREMRGTLGILQMVNVQADKQKLLHRFANESSQNPGTLRNRLCNAGGKKGGWSITGAWRARGSRTIATRSHTAVDLRQKCLTPRGIQATGAPEGTTVVV